jgi:AcrR family transcriptional regulator
MPTRDQLRTNARTTYRAGLTKDQVFRAAVRVADEGGIAALTMRRLAEELGVEAMSLYHHVADKDEVLAGMVDVVVSEISTHVTEIGTLPGGAGGNWKTAVRHTIVAAREVLLGHPWAPSVI